VYKHIWLLGQKRHRFWNRKPLKRRFKKTLRNHRS